jgi:hypothetical protein
MPSDEVRIQQVVAAMLRGEGRAVNDLPAELRGEAHRLYIEAVQAGKSNSAVIHDLNPH